MNKEELRKAHKHSSMHREEILKSNTCGCFYCLNKYSPTILTEKNWHEEYDGTWTVICPKCGIDSVIGDASGYKLTQEFLKAMQDYWFESTRVV